MNKPERLQKIFDICHDLHKSHEPITLDAIFKRLDSQFSKVTISDDLKYMKFFIIPKGKQWILTEDGLNAAKNKDIFQYSMM